MVFQKTKRGMMLKKKATEDPHSRLSGFTVPSNANRIINSSIITKLDHKSPEII